MDAMLRRTALWYGDLGLLAVSVARNLALPPAYLRLVVREIEIMGVRSLGLALTAAAFTGMVFALQSAINLARFGAENYVGPLVAMAIFRELGPVLTAILVGGKVASGITAELGSMKVTEQIDALRTLGVNYVKRLVVPRVLAAVIVFPLLTVLANILGVLGGMFTMFSSAAPISTVLERDRVLGAQGFPDRHWQGVFFGAIVTLIRCANGLRTGGTEAGAGHHRHRGAGRHGVIVSDFFLTKLFLMIFW
jgi:phospholipid/cholesterol/gamma-HCH transport system permease protein